MTTQLLQERAQLRHRVAVADTAGALSALDALSAEAPASSFPALMFQVARSALLQQHFVDLLVGVVGRELGSKGGGSSSADAKGRQNKKMKTRKMSAAAATTGTTVVAAGAK